MTELKVYFDTFEYDKRKDDCPDTMYSQKEVDKVITEKDEEIRKLSFQLWSARFEAAEAKCDGPRMARCRYMADKFKEVTK